MSEFKCDGDPADGCTAKEIIQNKAAKIEELEKAFQTQVRERYKLIIKVKDKAKEILTEEELNLICQHPETRVDEYLKAIAGEPPGFPSAGATDKEWRKYLAHEFANSLRINFKLEAKLEKALEFFLDIKDRLRYIDGKDDITIMLDIDKFLREVGE